MTLDSLHKLIIDYIEKTNKPIFMTGKAGTGKTTFLRYIRSNTKKNLVVVAPTAVAAINAGGVTIHSFFQVPFGPILPMPYANSFNEFSAKSFGPEKSKIIKCLQLLVIDEIS
ncbi:MAG: helicase, partial [Pedobacter sp.]